MVRRLSVLVVVWAVVLGLVSTGTARAQEGGTADDEESVDITYYGDAELIDVLRTYDLLDEWTSASPVSPQASLLLVTASGAYQAQRQEFLNSIEAWAARTRLVREEVARIDAAQTNADHVRSVVIQVRDALVFDDRLATGSKTLVEIEDGLGQLAALEIPEAPEDVTEDSLTRAEIQLGDIRERAEAELQALNGVEPAFTSSGISAFLGFEELQAALNNIDQLIERGRELVRPAREESERLVASALAQIPSLHAARMLGASDVGGLSVVTVDAYIRAAQRSACSLDWALLAGIGHIESNHGRVGGASVSRSGQVSAEILGPLLDGGASDRASDGSELDGDQWAAIAEAVKAVQRLVLEALAEASEDESDLADLDLDQGNGFAVVVDSDDGRLDGNEQWDRAIGPMQFLPETWSRWAIDGNGDGVSDPHNLYDAAATAGRFLCDLSATRGSSPSTFLLGYNSSTSYVRDVLSTAEGLRGTSIPDV